MLEAKREPKLLVVGGVGQSVREFQKLDTEHTAPKKSEHAYKRSAFGILIQTNQRPINNEHSMVLARRLERVVLAIFHSRDYLERCLHFNIEGDGMEKVLAFITKYSVERGTTKFGGGIHAHVIVRILHRTNLWLDGTPLRELVVELWNKFLQVSRMPWEEEAENIMVHVRFIRSSLDYDDYVLKEIDKTDPERAWLREVELAEGEARASNMLKEFIDSTH